jgi:hypothetical protein
MRTIVFFIEEPSAREMLEGVLSRVLPKNIQVRSSGPPNWNWFCEKAGSDENGVLVNVYEFCKDFSSENNGLSIIAVSCSNVLGYKVWLPLWGETSNFGFL